MRLWDIDDHGPIDLEEIGWAYRVARTVQVAHKLGVFGALLGGALPSAEVAARCGTVPALTERLLVLLAACGWIRREPDGTFRLSDEGRRRFDPDSPLYFAEGLNHAMRSWERWHRLEEQLTGQVSGGPPQGPADPGAHHDFVWAMHHYSVRGRARWLAGNVDLSGCRTLLDLGGGPGSYSIALCERYPELRSTVLDLPQTEPILTANVARFGLSDRIAFLPGDWNQASYGGPYDAALLSNILHGAGHGCEDRVAKTYAALARGGRLIVQDFLLDNDRNGPLPAAIFNLHVGAYAVDEMLALLADAGFERATLRAYGPHGNGLVTARKPG